MQPAPLAGKQAGRRRLGQQRMPGPVSGVGGGFRERPALQLPQAHTQRLGIQPGHVGQLLLGQCPPGHRHRGQHGPGLRTAVADPDGQQFRQPGRQPASAPLARPPSARPAVGGQRLGNQLLGKERVALAAGVQLVRVHGRQLTAGQAGRLLGHLVAGQRRQPDLPRVPAAPCVGQPAAHGRFQRRLVAADGRHHGDRVRAPRPGQEGQEVQGGAVGPVHVLDHHGEPGPPGHRRQQLGDPGEHALALAAHRPGPGPCIRGLQVRQQARRLGLRVRRDGGQRVRQQRAALEPAQRVECLADRQERELLGQRQAGAPGRQRPAQALRHEPRLADAGVTRHEHQPRPAAQRGAQVGYFTLPAGEHHRTDQAPLPSGPQPVPSPEDTRR